MPNLGEFYVKTTDKSILTLKIMLNICIQNFININNIKCFELIFGEFESIQVYTSKNFTQTVCCTPTDFATTIFWAVIPTK